MLLINQLIDNISKYGNSKLYMINSNEKLNTVLIFQVDDNGDIKVTAKIEEHDIPYWDGKTLNPKAKYKYSSCIQDYPDNRLHFNLSTVLYSDFYSCGVIMLADEKLTKVNTENAVNKIYQIVNSMLQLSNRDLAHWVLGNCNSVENNLIVNAEKHPAAYKTLTTEEAIADINEQFIDVQKRLHAAYTVYHEYENAPTEKERDKALEKWDAIYYDDTMGKKHDSK